MRFAQRIEKLQPYLFVEISRKINERRAAGARVISFAIGMGPVGALSVGAVADAVSPIFALSLNAALGIVALALIGHEP